MIGQAFDSPVEENVPKDERSQLRDKFLQLACLDYKVNGFYLNAPYKVRIGDETYKGSLRVNPQKMPLGEDRDITQDQYVLVIERPVKYMASVDLKNPY